MLAVPAEPLGIDLPGRVDPRPQPKPGGARTERRRQAGDQASLLGCVEPMQLGFEVQLFFETMARPVVAEVSSSSQCRALGDTSGVNSARQAATRLDFPALLAPSTTERGVRQRETALEVAKTSRADRSDMHGT